MNEHRDPGPRHRIKIPGTNVTALVYWTAIGWRYRLHTPAHREQMVTGYIDSLPAEVTPEQVAKIAFVLREDDF
ncbi:hypothetical protein [Streptomyces sp. NPDC002666]